MRLGRRKQEGKGSVLLVTTDSLPGFEVVEVLGLVAGEASDRERALETLARTAAERGADVVLAVRLDSSASGGAFVSDRESFAFGTAVRVRWAASQRPAPKGGHGLRRGRPRARRSPTDPSHWRACPPP